MKQGWFFSKFLKKILLNTKKAFLKGVIINITVIKTIKTMDSE